MFGKLVWTGFVIGLLSFTLAGCSSSLLTPFPVQLTPLQVSLITATIEPTIGITQVPTTMFETETPTATLIPGIFFTYSRDGLVQGIFQNGEAHCLGKLPGQWMDLFDTSPSGQWLLLGSFTQGQIALYIKSTIKDNSPERIGENVAGASWIDEQTFLFWTIDGQIYWGERSFDGIQAQKITEGNNPSYCSMQQQLAFIRKNTDAGTNDLYIFDMATQSEQLIRNDASTTIEIAGYHPIWTSECQSLLYLVDPMMSEQEQSDFFSIIEIDTGKASRLTVPSPSTPLYISDTGQNLVYGTETLDGLSTSWFLALDWRESLITSQTPLENYIPLNWAEPGKSLVLAGQDGEYILEFKPFHLSPITRCEVP